MSRYLNVLKDRVLVYDGAMGTSIQGYELTAEDFGGPELEGCNDYLVISRPDVVEEIHASFLEVGCDVVETDTFRSNRLTLKEYGLDDRVLEINRAAAQLARRAADRFSTEARPRFVAGSIGPSGFLPSTSDPTLGNMTFEELADVFAEQARGLVEGGVDVLLIETSQDILEVKAQVTGIRRTLKELGREDVPIQAQVTLDTSGRMLLGTDIAASMVILESLRVDVLGLNCSTGPEHMRQPIRWLAENSRLPISVIPNAGIPHNEGGTAVYPLTPEQLADAHEEFVADIGVAVVGGCCGTTPEHLRQVVDRVWGRKPLERSVPDVPRVASAMTATDMVQDPAPTLIGERVNAQGSRVVKRLLLADDYEGILEVARGQVEGGAHLLDVCVAVTERQDEAAQMRTLVKQLAQTVEAPLVVDTTEKDVVEAALRQYPGRATINSINLENGRQRIDDVVPLAVEHGAALVALTIDEEGMAKTAERKLEVARRIYDICVGEYGLRPADLIYDDLTFTLATGDEEFRRSAVATIDGIRAIKRELPGVLTSLGVSNVSFGLSKHARAVLNSVFLHHCVEAGLDMAIVNPAHITPYAEIDDEQRALADDLIFDRREDALARFIAYFESADIQEEADVDPTADMSADEAIHWKILHRKKEGVEAFVDRAVHERAGGADAGREALDAAAVEVLNGVLLPAMKEVGDKFGAGELILPFVLQSAEVMKRAVAQVETYLEKVEGQTKGRVVLATVYGDVHDIGKSLVNTILSNNGYTVYDLGKQVPVNTIIEKAVEVGADAIGLSALLVSTSKQMPLAVKELAARGLEFPVLCGGAAINPSFIRVASYVDQDADELYQPGVWYCKDAFEGLSTVEKLVDDDGRAAFVEARLREVREGVARRAELKEKAAAMGPSRNGDGPAQDVDIPAPPFLGVKVIERIPLDELYPLIDLNTLYRLNWGAKNAKGEAWERAVKEEFEPRLERFKREARTGGWAEVRAAYGYFPAVRDGDALVVYDPTEPSRELTRFEFPRQQDREGLCLADYFRTAEVDVDRELAGVAGKGEGIGTGARAEGVGGSPAGIARAPEPTPGTGASSVPDPAARSTSSSPSTSAGQTRDVVGLQIVTVGDRLLHRSEALMKDGDYSEGYYLHGFGVRLAEAAAEWVNRHMNEELRLGDGRGLRYSWGYPACPDHMEHFKLFELLPARERLGMELTEAGSLVPELSTAALVVHHPEAKYFSV